jgi:[acyl-carrier-protein] S-malonyltransferase
LVIDNLANQISGSVLWTQSIRTLADNDVTRAIEIGPGKVLSGLCTKIQGSFECLAMDSLEVSLEGI